MQLDYIEIPTEEVLQYNKQHKTTFVPCAGFLSDGTETVGVQKTPESLNAFSEKPLITFIYIEEEQTVPVYSCTPWQIRKALNNLGLRQQVEDSIAASTDHELKDGWEYATDFISNDPFVITMGAALGKTEAETAELIQWAGTL